MTMKNNIEQKRKKYRVKSDFKYTGEEFLIKRKAPAVKRQN